MLDKLGMLLSVRRGRGLSIQRGLSSSPGLCPVPVPSPMIYVPPPVERNPEYLQQGQGGAKWIN